MGSLIGTQKVAAAHHGLSLEEYLQRHADGLRWCYRCKTWKPNDLFDRDSTRPGGLAYRCIPCSRVLKRKAKSNFPASKNERQAAVDAVRYAIRRGLLAPAHTLPCFCCGKPAERYHHHLGYARRHLLDVQALCCSCHAKTHYSME